MIPGGGIFSTFQARAYSMAASPAHDALHHVLHGQNKSLLSPSDRLLAILVPSALFHFAPGDVLVLLPRGEQRGISGLENRQGLPRAVHHSSLLLRREVRVHVGHGVAAVPADSDATATAGGC